MTKTNFIFFFLCLRVLVAEFLPFFKMGFKVQNFIEFHIFFSPFFKTKATSLLCETGFS